VLSARRRVGQTTAGDVTVVTRPPHCSARSAVRHGGAAKHVQRRRRCGTYACRTDKMQHAACKMQHAAHRCHHKRTRNVRFGGTCSVAERAQSPGTDGAGVRPDNVPDEGRPGPVQMRQGWARSRCRCGQGQAQSQRRCKPGRSQSRCRCGQRRLPSGGCWAAGLCAPEFGQSERQRRRRRASGPCTGPAGGRE
jgi:hypothetical protein